MARVNLTLDVDTYAALERHAKQARARRATLIREILREGLARRDALAQRKKLAKDYATGRSDARKLLKDLEAAQLELLDDEQA